MPTRQMTHIDRALTNMSVAYMQAENAFIADKVFPVMPVQKQSDTYFIYSKADYFRDEARERSKGTESAGGDYSLSTAPPYYCRRISYHTTIDDEDRANSDSPLAPDRDATEFVTQKLLINKENRWANTFFKDSVWGTDITGVSSSPASGKTLQWDQSAADPIKTIRNYKTQMLQTTGKEANTLVVGPQVLDALLDNDEVIDRIKYTQRGIVTTDLLATMFGVDNLYVSRGIQNTAAKGKNAAMSFIVGKHALLCYTDKNPGIKKATAGLTFSWNGYMGAGAFGNTINRIQTPLLGRGAERIEGEMAFDQKVIAKDMGIFFKDIVA